MPVASNSTKITVYTAVVLVLFWGGGWGWAVFLLQFFGYRQKQCQLQQRNRNNCVYIEVFSFVFLFCNSLNIDGNRASCINAARIPSFIQRQCCCLQMLEQRQKHQCCQHANYMQATGCQKSVAPPQIGHRQIATATWKAGEATPDLRICTLKPRS